MTDYFDKLLLFVFTKDIFIRNDAVTKTEKRYKTVL